MNIEQARRNMIEQQICAGGGVRSQDVLDLFKVVRREHFVPPAYADLAFADIEIPLHYGENMLRPLVEARILEAVAIKPHEQVLEIGAGSGYMAALLSYRARHVTSIEIEPALKQMAETNLAGYGIDNVAVELGDGGQGWGSTKYDVIVISGALPVLHDNFLRQIKTGGRIAAFIGDTRSMTGRIVSCTSETRFETRDVFAAKVRPLRVAAMPSRFRL